MKVKSTNYIQLYSRLVDLGVKIPCSENICDVVFSLILTFYYTHLKYITRMERFSFFISRSGSQGGEAVKGLRILFLLEKRSQE